MEKDYCRALIQVQRGSEKTCDPKIEWEILNCDSDREGRCTKNNISSEIEG